MEENQLYTIILRHDTSTNWIINDPVLILGEYGVEDDTHRVKRGDGVSKWSELLYDHFGFEYAITFANLNGDIEDNAELTAAFKNTIQKDTFESVDNKIVTDITLTEDENAICKLTKVSEDVVSGNVLSKYINIISDDNSITGLWSIDDKGISTLNLKSMTVVDDYNENISYKKGQLCFYDNTILRAKYDIEAGKEINLDDWSSSSTTTSQEVEFNSDDTTLEADTVQGAITELDDKLETMKKDIENNDELFII